MKNFQSRCTKSNLQKIDNLICRFNRYLDLERGLSRLTRNNYCFYVRVFLSTEFKSKKIRIKDFHTKGIFKFILSYSQGGGSRRSQIMIYSLRAFFRFLKLTDLADSLPSVAHHGHNLPEFLSHKQLQELLKSCNKNTEQGLRDYAILMLLTQLGLRRSEVSKLTLNDFDWDKSEIIVRGKGSISRFPISQELGNALVNYLKRARPPCPCNSFFIRLYQPLTRLAARTISGIVRSGLLRAGLNPRHKGAHLLRHSFATQLLTQGKSLHEIGMVLRHKDIRTTAIYAHVDFAKLKLLALPWPITPKEVHHA
jgi:site-specific recombinase XerD